jgi:hypothetical protein
MTIGPIRMQDRRAQGLRSSPECQDGPPRPSITLLRKVIREVRFLSSKSWRF